MLRKIRNSKITKGIACYLIVNLVTELVAPNMALALTSGPTQPEVQSFEPVGTTDMVDLFTGDFVYNIPLLDVEGYPVNISYHGGVNMEQEASWVGLGWNINPGEINRTVRGVPDDFNGDSVKKNLNIEDERTLRFGAALGVEPGGVSNPFAKLNASLGVNVNISNYRGVSADFSLGAGVSLFRCVSAGVNLGVGSQTGASIDYNAGLNLSTSNFISGDMAAGVGMGFTTGYNTRSGLKDRSFSVSTNVNLGGRALNGPSSGVNVPIGLKNFVPVITNSSVMKTYYGQIKVGLEGLWSLGYGTVTGMQSVLHYNEDGSRKSYGYLYAENATDTDMLDFTRDKDGMFNKSMQYLPAGNMTYDVYSVNGQGTGGSFRPFRNDAGSVYDPYTESDASNKSATIEAGVGWNFSLGGDASVASTTITSGPWGEYRRPFQKKGSGSIYENTYFKQAGELTAVDPGFVSSMGGANAVNGTNANQLPLRKYNSESNRDPRANLIYYFNGFEASNPGVADQAKLYSYRGNGFANGPVVAKDSFKRVAPSMSTFPSGLGRKKDHISEVVQVQTDGRKYIYGIPAMNNVQKEVTFSIGQPGSGDLAKGQVPYTSGVDDSKGNQNGLDHYYSSSVTPSYAHSYLLTSVLSTDYVDITGDGPTEDDFGSYTKFNYSCKDTDYRWRAPYESGKAQYNPGFWSDQKDDKGSYVIGSREQWMLHSIETKNFVAEFYTSRRTDALGVKDTVLKGNDGYVTSPYNRQLDSMGHSYKLDSIKLYNKHDRFINQGNAVPIKTVIFSYNYALCQGIPNTEVPGSGKLTLKSIFIRYGNSDKSMISPYQFDYNEGDPDSNPPYDLAAKDRWGMYKANNPNFTNFEFPYTDQGDRTRASLNAAAWSLQQITLPSGGRMKISYEADDYAYVQDKVAQEMFMVAGIGKSRNFTPGNTLYSDKNSPNLYLYFKRQTQDEIPGLSLKDNYIKGIDCISFNFKTKLVDNFFEPIKGYAAIDTTDPIGLCSDTTFAYIKLKQVNPEEGDANLHPATYTALNVGRYNLPQILFPGNNPSNGDLDNILAGLKYSFNELISVAKDPIVRMVEKEKKAKEIDLSKSYVRLNSPGLHKIGGGQRVSKLEFFDNWNQMVGGNSQTASYGKQYDYTTDDDGGYGHISSGVASYEPQIGGDENPFRIPVKYQAQSSSKWPPNDPVVLYQEMPMGETLFPSPVVGYSKVTVTSIHQDVGRSSQSEDIHEFYTAKDYPVIVANTSLQKLEDKTKFGFTGQEITLKVSQGYSLTFNDMHGKVKKVEHRIILPKDGTTQLVSYQQYKYKESGGQLDNHVDVLKYDPATGQMTKVNQLLGYEMDMTIDTREKKEYTDNDQFYANLNVTTVFIVPVPVPLPVPWETENTNLFSSVVATKVIQQYGILDKVISYQEGALVTTRNEVFDAVTGQAVVTSLNNEYGDIEYNVNYPGYWGYDGMKPSYLNTGYTEVFTGANMVSVAGGQAVLPTTGQNFLNYREGDELFLQAISANGTAHIMPVWVIGYSGSGSTCRPIVQPRYPADWSTSDTYLTTIVKVIRSSYKNQLNESLLSYQSLDNPINGNTLKDYQTNLISIKANQFALDGSTKLTNSGLSALNPYLSGVNQTVCRLSKEWVYQNTRNYTGTSVRKAGVFETQLFWTHNLWTPSNECSKAFPWFKPLRNTDLSYINWIPARTISKWSPWGQELENVDALGNFTTAVYGYNEELPVATAQNAKQGEVLAEGFEDYQLLQKNGSLTTFNYSPFRAWFNTTTFTGSGQYQFYDLINTLAANMSVVKNTAHTGLYSLKLPSSGLYLAVPLATGNPGTYDAANLLYNKKYILSFWVRSTSSIANATDYNLLGNVNGSSFVKKSNLIEGWQQYEVVFTTPSSGNSLPIQFPGNYYLDDVRFYPADAEMKAYVYHPTSEKLMATLDENNYATFYEYDQEGNLVRTKKETERGVLTVSESRSATQSN